MRYSWKITAKGSAIEFRILYYRVANIKGNFLKFKGNVQSGSNFANPIINLIIDTASVSTLDDQWDQRLLNEDFFFFSNYPAITFTSDAGCQLRSGLIEELSGWLSIRDKRQAVTMVVTSSSIEEDAEIPTATFMLMGFFSLKDFGYSLTNDVIGDEVRIKVKIRMTGIKVA